MRHIARLRGGGSALPGLFVEKIDPDFIRRTLSELPRGVVIISGTNGKTTTTKIVVELLESQGLRVFTNRTGSNFTRGVAAALLGEVDARGALAADIAVLELDEAHAVHFVRAIPPNYCLLLNVMRDQLDRFGEIDTTASLLRTIAESTRDGIVINRDDPRLSRNTFTQNLTAPIRTYGVHVDLQKLFPSDDSLKSDTPATDASPLLIDDTSLESLNETDAVIAYQEKKYPITLKLEGVYNVLNAVGAIALCRMIMGELLDENAMIKKLENVAPAFGRGETLIVRGQPIELVLVKNPSGFRLGLRSFSPDGCATMIAINDNYADGRDMSWLWDVDFTSLQPGGVAYVSGIRAYDMALRLQYDEVPISEVEPHLKKALDQFISAHASIPKRIFCTYTAMLALRRELSNYTKVERAL